MELATPGASWAFAVPFCNHADSHPSGPAPDPQVPCCIFPLVTGPTGDAPGEGRARLWTAPGTPVGAPPQGRWHGGSEALTSQRQCWQGCEHGQVHGTCDLLGTNHRKECARSCGPALLGTHPLPVLPKPPLLAPSLPWTLLPPDLPSGFAGSCVPCQPEAAGPAESHLSPCALDAPGGILCQGLRLVFVPNPEPPRPCTWGSEPGTALEILKSAQGRAGPDRGGAQHLSEWLDPRDTASGPRWAA